MRRLSSMVEAAEGGLVPVSVAGDPEISGVATTDLLEPGRYLVGGELVLTGLAWWRAGEPGRSRGFVAALVRAGAAALAAGEAALGGVPDDLVEACAEAGLPLLRVPVDHAFTTITERINRQLTGGDLAGLLARHRGLVAAIATRPGAGAGLAGVIDLVAAELGVACWVISPTGRAIAGEGLSEPVRAKLARRFLRAPRLPVTESGLTLTATDPGPRLRSWILVSEPGLPPAVIDELAALAALEGQLARRPSAAAGAVVSALLRGIPDPPRSPTVVVTASGRWAEVMLTEAELVAVPADEGEWIALAPADSGLVGRLRAVLGALGGEPVRVGVSDPASSAPGLLAALAEARLAATTVTAGVAGADRLSTHAVLLAAVPPAMREAYRRRVLGPLLEHPDLLQTLQSYLECDGSWSRCAARMHLHVNTLRYRVEKIEALTGRDLRRLADQADLLLALG